MIVDVSPASGTKSRLGRIALAICLVGAWPLGLQAQTPEQADGAPQVGDRWSYEAKDEITGYPKDSFSEVVTEVSANEAVTNVTFDGKPGSVLVIYDRDWNRTDNLTWKFKPNDGMGLRLARRGGPNTMQGTLRRAST
jgi:hypothetical protein